MRVSRRALLDEAIGAVRGRGIDVSRDRVNRTTLLNRLRRGDEGAAVQASFDDQNPVAPTADDAVAHRKGLAIGLDCHGKLGNDRAVAAADFVGQTRILRWIKFHQTGTNDRNRASFRGQCALMGGCVDAARQTADDGET